MHKNWLLIRLRCLLCFVLGILSLSLSFGALYVTSAKLPALSWHIYLPLDLGHVHLTATRTSLG